MFTETRKIHIIEEVLKINSEATLVALEGFIKNSKKKLPGKTKQISIYDFVGVLTKQESKEMKKAIKDTCETVNPDDWK